MEYEGNAYHRLGQKPIYWGLMGLLSLVLTARTFQTTYFQGPEYRRFVEFRLDSTYRINNNRSDLEKFINAIGRRFHRDEAVLAMISKTGFQVELGRSWSSHLDHFQDPTLKGKKFRFFFHFKEQTAENPVRIEIDGELVDDLEDNQIWPWVGAILTVLFLGLAFRLQWKIWQRQLAIHPSSNR